MAQEINIYLSDDQMLEDVGNAFNSRTRRDILRLCANKSYSIYGLAEALNMAIPTISFHVKILQKAGLVIVLQHPNKKDNEKNASPKGKAFYTFSFCFYFVYGSTIVVPVAKFSFLSIADQLPSAVKVTVFSIPAKANASIALTVAPSFTEVRFAHL